CGFPIPQSYATPMQRQNSGGGLSELRSLREMVPNTATHSTIASADTIAARPMPDLYLGWFGPSFLTQPTDDRHRRLLRARRHAAAAPPSRVMNSRRRITPRQRAP